MLEFASALFLLLFLGVVQQCFSFGRSSQLHFVHRSQRCHPSRAARQLQDVEVKTIYSMACISAPLGTLLDNYHGLFGVLQYNPSISSVTWVAGDVTLLRTSLWTPALFSVAGAAMTYLLFKFEEALQHRGAVPSWSKVWGGIGLFSLQYYVSGLLDYVGSGLVATHMCLFALSAAGVWLLDRSLAGLLLVVSTALAGPLTEILLVNGTNAYRYLHADMLGVCSWIVWVYALGAPAVANLARALRGKFIQSEGNF